MFIFSLEVVAANFFSTTTNTVMLLAGNRFLGLPWVVGWLCNMPQTGKSVSVKSIAL
jgi:hypothetical protein